MNKNLYWSVYKNLEKEFMKLTDYIHISKDQLNVYSMHIANLIVRVSIEIESISKELYQQLGGQMNPINPDGTNRDLYFDTDCLQLLEDKWIISEKEVVVSAINVFLEDDFDRILTPLRKSYKRGTSGSNWKKAYQALKHDRVNSLNKATIKNLLDALGALFILNLYYINKEYKYNSSTINNKKFDSRMGSDLFSIKCFSATGLTCSLNMGDHSIISDISEKNKCIYIDKETEETFRKTFDNYCKDYEITVKNYNDSPIIKKFLSNNPDYITDGKSINQICLDIGGINLLQNIFSFKNMKSDYVHESEIVVNKNATIYPNLNYKKDEN